MKALAILMCLTGTVAAGPIEPLWQTDVACSWSMAVGEWRDSLAWIDNGRVMRVDRATGKLVKPLAISRPTQPGQAALGWDFARLETTIGDDLVIHGGHFFTVIDGLTGMPRWEAQQGDHDGGLPRVEVVDGDIIFLHPASLGRGDPPVFLERLERLTGKRKWRAETVGASGQIDWVALDNGILYLTTRPDMLSPRVFLARFDLATGSRLDAVETLTSIAELVMPGPRREHVGDPTLVSHDITYDQVGDELVAISAGRTIDRYGIAGSRVVYTSATRAPALVTCDNDKHLRAFDPSGAHEALERATITGTVACTTCASKVFPPMRVVIGDAVAKTDRRGRFTIKVAARGALTIYFDLPSLASPIFWAGDTQPVVHFLGKRSYDLGTLQIRKDCGPLEDC